MSIIFERLSEYSDSDAYPFHMPGHKRHMSGDVLSDVSRIDITEIDGFDNLHDAQGIILEGQKLVEDVSRATCIPIGFTAVKKGIEVSVHNPILQLELFIKAPF